MAKLEDRQARHGTARRGGGDGDGGGGGGGGVGGGGGRRRRAKSERTGERGEIKEEERVGTNRLGLSAILLAARAGQVSHSCPQEAWKRQSRLHRENE